jgi:hypothetical protein
MAILWRDRGDTHMLRNVHNVPAEGNFWDERQNVVKPLPVADYNHHMGDVNKGDRMANF